MRIQAVVNQLNGKSSTLNYTKVLELAFQLPIFCKVKIEHTNVWKLETVNQSNA